MPAVTPQPLPDSPAPSEDACYLALKARDARFDGSFFVGVTSTRVYCRPVCKVRTPRRENCRFYSLAAQAEQAGFRPCLRCRPELAPQSSGSALRWSTQDASALLAQAAARWLDSPESWGEPAPSVAALAAHLGVSDRHVRRIFAAQFGVSPLQYLQTRRLLSAKQMLTDTRTPIAQVALGAGFASVRRFNAAFKAHYRLNPSQLRDAGAALHHAGNAEGATTVRLGYRPPYDVAALLGFFEARLVRGVEDVRCQADDLSIRRSFQVTWNGQRYRGWLHGRFDTAQHQFSLRVSHTLRDVLPLVIARVRSALDLDANPLAINAVLHHDFPHGDGLRVPGALDGFELGVRAILGQQVSVAAARTLAQRLVQQLGQPVATPWPEVDRLFPDASVFLALGADAGRILGELGVVHQRQRAIVALAQAVQQGLALHPGAHLSSALQALHALPGVGPWTAQYIAMRALRWSDAFPSGDVALLKNLGFANASVTLRRAQMAAEQRSEAWRPWRAYAVVRAWADPHCAQRLQPSPQGVSR